MTVLQIPPLVNSDGTFQDATVSIDLVDGNGRKLIGLLSNPNLFYEYQELDLTDSALEVELVPNTTIKLPGNIVPWYLVSVTYGTVNAVYQIIVPESATPVALETLVDASSPTFEYSYDTLVAAVVAQLAADGRLLPTGATAGDVVEFDGTDWVATGTLGGGGAP